MSSVPTSASRAFNQRHVQPQQVLERRRRRDRGIVLLAPKIPADPPRCIAVRSNKINFVSSNRHGRTHRSPPARNRSRHAERVRLGEFAGSFVTHAISELRQKLADSISDHSGPRRLQQLDEAGMGNISISSSISNAFSRENCRSSCLQVGASLETVCRCRHPTPPKIRGSNGKLACIHAPASEQSQ